MEDDSLKHDAVPVVKGVLLLHMPPHSPPLPQPDHAQIETQQHLRIVACEKEGMRGSQAC